MKNLLLYLLYTETFTANAQTGRLALQGTRTDDNSILYRN